MRTRAKKGGSSVSSLMASGAGVGCDGAGRRRRRGKGMKHGAGWWDDFTGWIDTNVKKPKHVSTGLKAFGASTPGLWGEAANLAGNVADSFGWGKAGGRRRRKR